VSTAKSWRSFRSVDGLELFIRVIGGWGWDLTPRLEVRCSHEGAVFPLAAGLVLKAGSLPG